MTYLKSHFWYNKNQRNGILLLMVLIVVFQCIIFFYNFPSEGRVALDDKGFKDIQRQLDSLKEVAVKNSKPSIAPFNPNYISDFKGEQLGMSIAEIDRLHSFRKKNKFVNSAAEFQKATLVSDSLLSTITPYFKFPEWVTDKQKRVYTKKIYKPSTTDINKATSLDFQYISGIGKSTANRIVSYRKKLQGFTYKEQVYEVWGLNIELAEEITKIFNIVNPPKIHKININTASFKEVLKNPYIDYDLCKRIFDYRDEVAELQSISELKKIEGFPLDKYERIVLYLIAE